MTDSPHRPTRMIVAAGTVLAVTLLALAVAGWSLLAAEERRQADRVRADATRVAEILRATAIQTALAGAPTARRMTLAPDGARVQPPPPSPFTPEPPPEDARIAFLLRQGGDDAGGPAADLLLAGSSEPVVQLHLALRRALDGAPFQESQASYMALPPELRSTARGVHLGLLGRHAEARARALLALSTRDEATAASLLVGAVGRDATKWMAEEHRWQAELDERHARAFALIPSATPPVPEASEEQILVTAKELVAVRRMADRSWTVVEAPTSSIESRLHDRARESGASLVGGPGDAPLPWWPSRSVVVQSTGLDGFRGLVLAGIGIAAAAAVIAFVAFVRAADRAARLAALRTEFVATVGHELRTPVAVIRTSAETLERGLATTEEQRAVFLGAILRESERLAGLLGNVLDFARMESGSQRFRFERADLCEIARECVHARRESRLAAPGRVELATPEEPVMVECDPRAVGAALANLLDNAVKFGGDRKPVTVRVFPGDEAASPYVQVEDHGLGVPDEQKERIFERFYRDPRPAVQATRGTGIGLALCGRVAAAHGGELVVSDTPGGGATFRLALPAVRRS